MRIFFFRTYLQRVLETPPSNTLDTLDVLSLLQDVYLLACSPTYF